MEVSEMHLLWVFNIWSVKLTTKRKHVLDDLEPYICTFPGCGLETFQSQHAWFDHELVTHRNKWRCPKCSEDFPTPQSIRSHFYTSHAENMSEKQMDSLVGLNDAFEHFVCIRIQSLDTKDYIRHMYPLSKRPVASTLGTTPDAKDPARSAARPLMPSFWTRV